MENGIYIITNIVNNKIYIGSTYCKGGVNRRWSVHKSQLNKNKHINKHLQFAWNKYGIDSFTINLIEVITDSPILLEREQYYLDLFKPYNQNIGYNISKISSAPMLGLNHSDESKIKIGNASLGNTYSLGFKHSDETKKLMINNRLNESYETRVKRSKSLIGNKNSIGVKPVNQIKVIQLNSDYKIIKVWDSIIEAAKTLKLIRQNISKVCKGEREFCGGFRWKHKN